MAVDIVIAVPAVGEGVGIVAAENHIVPATARELVDADSSIDQVIPVAADNLVDPSSCRTARVSVQSIVTSAAVDQIAHVAAVDGVPSISTVEPVDSATTVNQVVAAFCISRVVIAAHVEQVSAVGGDQHLTRIGTGVGRSIEIAAVDVGIAVSTRGPYVKQVVLP